jgi:transcription termination/antitermination protein NusG
MTTDDITMNSDIESNQEADKTHKADAPSVDSNASDAPSEDVNAPDAPSEDVNAPDASSEDVNAPDASSEDSNALGDPEIIDNPKFAWYVVQVYSGREKKVIKTLRERIALNHLEALFGEILVPTETVMEIKGGKKKRNERKFFPGYVLVQMELNDESWHMVRSAPNVMGFIGGKGDTPTPITAKEISSIFTRVEEGISKPKPKTLFEVGEVIRVIEGPFADFDGVVQDINYEKSRLRVAVLIFGRSTPVELEFGQVQKV